MQEPTNASAPQGPGANRWADKYLPAEGEAPYPTGTYGYGTGPIDINLIRGFLWRQRFALIGITVAALLIGLIATLLVQPVYEATATVRIDPEPGEIIEGQELGANFGSSDVKSYMATLSAVVKSRAIAYQVVDNLKLDTNSTFIEMEEDAEGTGAASPQAIRKARRELAADKLQSSVSVELPFEERIMAIKYSSTDPRLAATIANAYADTFLTDDLRRGFDKNSYALRYLNDKISEVRSKLQSSEKQALAYARANRIVGESLLNSSTDGDNGQSVGVPQTITASNLANINTAYTEARANRIAAEQRWKAAAGTPAATLPEVQQNTAFQNLVSERSRVSGQLADLRTRYGENYPMVRELRAQVSSIDAQIARSSKDIKDSLRQNYQVAVRQEQGLANELNSVSNATLNEQDRRVQFNQLDREAKALSSQLEILLGRYNQIASAANIQPGTITMLDAAIVPKSPSSPNMLKNLLIALVLGFAAAIGLATLREIFDDRLRSVDEVQRKLNLKPLGVTPLVDEITDTGTYSPIDEAYSSIRTAVDFVLPRRDHNVIQLTSSQSFEGKTTTAVALAKKYAQLGQKVLLIDADLRKPSISNAFGKSRSKQGFVEVLLGQAEFRDALLDQPEENLDVLPMGTIPPNPVDVLSSVHIRDFIDKHRGDYSLIIFDSPPVMGIADAPLLARLMDGVVFIVEANRAHFGGAKAAVRRLRDADANFLGIVLTKYRALDAGDSYNYAYKYYTYGPERERA